ncbi:beta-ketoacyl-[acyl-carrier-protein] synthase II [Longispora fulva]|uniref:3-oxoacyl-[acyl-carrier-protein] synthase II n=1 Tax=Longispora fulva TaxID=619741 RepID=A0A8J7GJ27_9ACTN|nr:beta-ketoacyl-[acyl-carrier-protein] synthase family protein [Longispora fulva]MBG6134339.1 3-oxoacyl-[acyl-carrier-protein] synthase II [Longispora fulva]GIG63048.1 beta-ketoacyl-[acyl-carrier-protein] synthase II [Longispora fulva]
MEQALITGLGVISCLGRGADTLWEALHAGPHGPRRVADPGANVDIPLVYLVPDADLPTEPTTWADAPVGPASRLAVAAAREALDDAGIVDAVRRGDVRPERVAVLLGTTMGDHQVLERERSGEWAPAAGWHTEYLVASVVADLLGGHGPVSTNSNACAASGYAIGLAVDMIRAGEADVVLVGGAEAYSRLAVANFNRMGATDPERCRPFDQGRRGTVSGEAAAMLVVEAASIARRRGASVYAEIAATGWSCDAHHPTAPEPGGAQIDAAMRRALRDGAASPAEIACVVPHGTGTELNDVVESEALRTLFEGRKVPLYSLKAQVGHTAGAAAGLAVATAALILFTRTVPPNVPLDAQDERCPVWLPLDAQPLKGRAVLANAYAFGGNNVSVLLRGVPA